MSGSAPPSYQALPSYQESKPGEVPAVVQGDAPPTVAVIATQPRPPPEFRDFPVMITDSKGQQVVTVLEYHAGLLTWLACGVLCLATVSVGLCFLGFIPFLIKSLKDVYHINPTDGKIVAIYKRGL